LAMVGLYPNGSIINLHLRALKKWEKVSIKKTGTKTQYLVVFKALVNLSHSWGGI